MKLIVCGECRFWDEQPMAPHLGLCRRKSPSPLVNLVRPAGEDNHEGKSVAYWPITSHDDWCGEFKEIG